MSNLTNLKHAGNVKVNVTPTGDQVDVPSPDMVLNAFRSQADTLKNELPGMIASSVQSQTKSGSSQNEVLSAVMFRLIDPLKFILKGDSLTKEQLDGFQKEISKFSDEVMGLSVQATSGSVDQKAQSADAVNKVLAKLTSHLKGVIGQIQNKALNT